MPEGKNTGRVIKIVIALGLFIAAVGFAISTYRRMNPTLEPEPPESSRMMKARKQEIQDGFRMGLETLNLTEEQEEQLKEWQAWSSKGKTKKEKRRHQQQTVRLSGWGN